MQSGQQSISESTLMARQSAVGYGATYVSSRGVSGGEHTIGAADNTGGGSTGEADRARALSEKIRKKKQGIFVCILGSALIRFLVAFSAYLFPFC